MFGAFGKTGISLEKKLKLKKLEISKRTEEEESNLKAEVDKL